MDSDYARRVHSPNITSTPPNPPPPLPQPEPTYDEDKKESVIPYLAKLTAFTVLFLSVLYALSSLVTYLVEKLLVKPQANSYDYSYFSGVDSFLVVSAFATLLVALPVSALLLFFVRRSENNESWRVSQKWRRIIYTITQIVLIITVVSTIIGTVYSVFSYSLNLDVGSSYYSGLSEDKKPSDNSSKIAAAVISGFIAVIIFSLGIVTLVSEYGAKWRPLAWGILVLFSLSGAFVGVSSIGKVQEAIKEQTKKQSQYDNSYSYSGNSSNDSDSDLVSPSDSSAKTTLDAVKGDLTYYANSNSGKYPTKAQWDDGSLKPKYLLSSDATLKKITYTPEGCTATGCSSYTISMKDENDKTITLNNTSDNSY